MMNPLNPRPAVQATAAASLKEADFSSELQGARVVPVPRMLTACHDAAPPASGVAPELDHALVRQAAPASAAHPGHAVRHKLSALLGRDFEKKNADWQHHLLQLAQHDLAWTVQHCADLEQMDQFQLRELLPLLRHDQPWVSSHWDDIPDVEDLEELLPLLRQDQAWTTRHWDDIKAMDGLQLFHLVSLLRQDTAWTSSHWDSLKTMDSDQWQHALPLLQHDQPWTSRHWDDLKEMDEHQLKALLPLLRHDQAWVDRHWDDLKTMDQRQLPQLLPLLRHDKAWTDAHWDQVCSMGVNRLGELSRLFSLRLLNDASDGFHGAASPYVREALTKGAHGIRDAIPVRQQEVAEPAGVLMAHGASRSTFDPDSPIGSYLTEKFRDNCQRIPAATFGVENEMFIPGMRETYDTADELNRKLGTRDYAYVGDLSLSSEAGFQHLPIEQVTSRLETPEAIERLQSSLAILNDWGAFTNRTAGVHIHTGIRQWKAADCLDTPEGKGRNAHLAQWDADLPKDVPGARPITPYQLLFMKQFLVNMVAMQKDFYQVSRESMFSIPNGPRQGDDLDQYYRDVSNARTYEELLVAANAETCCVNVNLQAYRKHGTVEVRGFTKKHGASMEVDPNLPVRDLVFMQDVLIKTLQGTQAILSSGASPADPVAVRPGEGLDELAGGYVQDAFLLEIVHALGQRSPEKRAQTMEAILKDRSLIAPETLRKIQDSHGPALAGDALGRHFLAALDGQAAWNPAAIENQPLRRTQSLRRSADIALSGHAAWPSNSSR